MLPECDIRTAFTISIRIYIGLGHINFGFKARMLFGEGMQADVGQRKTIRPLLMHLFFNLPNHLLLLFGSEKVGQHIRTNTYIDSIRLLFFTTSTDPIRTELIMDTRHNLYLNIVFYSSNLSNLFSFSII